MDQATALNYAKKYADVVRSIMDTKSIYLFGSYAKGSARKDSDIDIAIVVDNLDRDYYDLLVDLWKARYSVNLEIEPVLLIANEYRGGFLDEIMRTGIAV